jgi:hypothetical protein
MEMVARLRSALLLSAMALSSLAAAPNAAGQAFLGVDRNDYPGDVNMQTLRKTFAYTGYWLNNPPGADHNSWKGHRASLQAMGYGFLILFNGREYNELKASGDAAGVGTKDAAAATQNANAEGFPKNAIIFLDQEQGGRMLPEQRAYIHAWVDGVVKAGFRAGVYCSGIAFRESPKVSVITANDIRENAGQREIHFFISNDQCPPSPGCVYRITAPPPTASGLAFGEVWQYAQSPRRPEVTAACRATYASDGNCYPPGVAPSSGLHIDVDTADSADPSSGRKR